MLLVVLDMRVCDKDKAEGIRVVLKVVNGIRLLFDVIHVIFRDMMRVVYLINFKYILCLGWAECASVLRLYHKSVIPVFVDIKISEVKPFAKRNLVGRAVLSLNSQAVVHHDLNLKLITLFCLKKQALFCPKVGYRTNLIGCFLCNLISAACNIGAAFPCNFSDIRNLTQRCVDIRLIVGANVCSRDTHHQL